MKQKFDILRSEIMGMVSAITATIAKNNGISPDVLWASEDDYAKLDVYYHEAITALESKLAKKVSPSAKFVYLTPGTDYSLVVDLNQRWNSELRPLVVNRLQEYLVHCILNAWIAGFPGEITALSYADLAASDLSAIIDLLLRVSFSQDGEAHKEDGVTFEGDDEYAGASSAKMRRHEDLSCVHTDANTQHNRYEHKQHSIKLFS